MAKEITYDTFLEQKPLVPLIDVRSPSEYLKGHIPTALSVPLFSDEKRALIGTLFKKLGKRAAIEEGLKFVDMTFFANRAKEIAKENQIAIYCARGGLRSESVAWLLDLLGYEVLLFNRGYKGYRNWVLDQFSKSYALQVLGGKTGSCKTYIIKKLKNLGELVIDLEGLAGHKGSVFGGLFSSKPQPSQEMFENLLAKALYFSSSQDCNRIWVEDESLFIGRLRIPSPFFSVLANPL